MELKILPDSLSKKMLFELYKPIPEKLIREIINSRIKETGGNIRLKTIPLRAKLDFFYQFGLPNGYKLSDDLEKKLNNLKEIRKKKC